MLFKLHSTPSKSRLLWRHHKTGGLLWHQCTELRGCQMNYNMNKQQRKSNMWSTVTKGIFVFLKCGRFARAVTPANHKPAQLHLIWNGNKFALWWTGWMSTADITAQTCMPLPTSVFFLCPHSRVHMLKNTLPHCAFFHTNTFSVLVTDCTWSTVDVVPWITLSFFYSFIYFNFEQWRRSETLLFQPGHSLTLMAPNTPGSLSNETGSLLTVMSWMHPTKADVTGSAVCIVVSAVQAGQGCVIVVLWHIDFCHFFKFYLWVLIP